MNKKFLSAILFGALMVTSTGTFVSCKDYDDDIENLQSQINNLATKSDVEAKLAQLQSALNAAQAESSANAADIAALEKEVASMQAKIQAAVEADMAKYKADIEALIKKVEGVVGEIADYVTSVELVSSYTHEAEWPLALDFYTTTEKENVFEENIAGAITFVKGKQTNVGKTPVLVRVSPTNAVLSKEMISLVNSKGENLDAYFDVEVAPYTKLLGYTPETDAEVASRAAENNALWEVKFSLKEYKKEQYEALKYVDIKKSEDQVLYAVQVNNALASEETASRYVTSSYDVTLGKHSDFTAAGDLLFTVDGTSVEVINNRYTNASLSLKEQGTATMYTELAWAGAPATEAILKGDKKNVTDDAEIVADDRSEEALALAVQGTPLKIEIDEEIKDQVKALYVTLDKANAVESAPSELNAWNSYEYTGLNKVVEGQSTTITINGKETINDIIGFRVYAVNYDGTLVDPDGKAFYVLVGDQAQELNVVETSITPVSAAIVETEAVAVEALAKLEGVVNFTWTMDKDNTAFDLLFYKKDAETAFSRIADGQTSTQTNINDVVKVASIPANGKAWTDYKDGKANYGTLKAYDTNGFVVATLRVSFTKNIPTSAPEGFSIKTNQVVDGIYNCYLIPMKDGVITWTAEGANQGSMAMDQIFNMPAKYAENFSIKFATSTYNADNKAYTDAQSVAGDAAVVVDADLIDNATKHATSVSYNYGKISSEAKDKDGNIVDYVVDVTEASFETVYNCIYNDTYTWAWATREQLATLNKEWLAKNSDGTYKHEVPTLTVTYGTSMTQVEYTLGNKKANLDQFIFGVSTKDTKYNAFLAEPYEGSLKIVEEKTTFTSDANGKQEYFKPIITDGKLVGLEFLPESSNPEAAVASTLTITVVDMYGHERVIKIAGTVNKR